MPVLASGTARARLLFVLALLSCRTQPWPAEVPVVGTDGFRAHYCGDGVVDPGEEWVGAIEGIQITHDGTPSQVPASQILGTSIYISGWVFKYCAGLDEVVYGAGPSTSSAEKGCQGFDCSQIADYAMPAVDSPAAIATAFPSDPATTLYKVDLNLLAGGARVWQIAGPSTTVNVDADSGMVVP